MKGVRQEVWRGWKRSNQVTDSQSRPAVSTQGHFISKQLGDG
jgi:hypothetical protein